MAKEGGTFNIGIPVYEGVDLLDVAAPYEMFNWMKSELKKEMAVTVRIIAETKKSILTRDGLRLSPQVIFKRTPQLDLLWVPGGNPDDLERMMRDSVYMGFLRKQSEQVVPAAKAQSSECVFSSQSPFSYVEVAVTLG